MTLLKLTIGKQIIKCTFWSFS